MEDFKYLFVLHWNAEQTKVTETWEQLPELRWQNMLPDDVILEEVLIMLQRGFLSLKNKNTETADKRKFLQPFN